MAINSRMNLIARPACDGAVYLLLRDERQFGKLTDCEGIWLFFGEPGEGVLENYLNDTIRGDMSVREILPLIRDALEALDEREAAEFEAERAAESAWLRHAESCPEHFDEMVNDDMRCLF